MRRFKPVVLVEDDCTKSKGDLSKSQIPNLDPDQYEIYGWDDPKIVAAALKLKRLRQQVLQAIRGNHVEALAAFAANFPHTLSENDSESLSIFCEIQLIKTELDFVRLTMPQRNDSLHEKTKSHLKRKVVAIMGPNHGEKARVSSLNVPYIILNPEKLTH
jgi:hypothetical protein